MPWKALNVDIVVESTGRFTDPRGCGKTSIRRGKTVIISAPAKDPDATVVLGVNEQVFDAKTHHIVSRTPRVRPTASRRLRKSCSKNFGIKHGVVTTIHSHQRSATARPPSPGTCVGRNVLPGMSMIPTSTGAAKALHLVIPELKGKLDGLAIRVPDAKRLLGGPHRPNGKGLWMWPG